MFRRLSVVLAAGCLALVAAPASGDTVTETNTEKNLVETFVDVRPSCEEDAPLYEITATSNLVEHETIKDDGTSHFTFTQTGKFVAEPLEAGLPSYTGRFTVWGGFNQNGSTVSGTFTFSVTATGSDGSRLRNSTVDHFNVRPDGTVNEFFHCH
jgi:hypothetical protein